MSILFKRKLYVCLLLLIVKYQFSFAQELNKVAPASPEVSNLLKNLEIPVSHYTGVPSISFPIRDMSIKGVSFPVQLSYNASGNRVQDQASFVGLGWNVGGLPFVSRTIKDKPDEIAPGVINLFNNYTIQQIYDNPTYEAYREIGKNNIDMEADIYTFSINGKSGTFWWDYNEEKYLVSPYYNIKIIYPAPGGPITIVDEDGTVYKFTITENTRFQSAETVLPVDIPKSWRISSIVNYEQTDSITFAYQLENLIKYGLNNQYRDYLVYCDNSPQSFLTPLENKPVSVISNGEYSIHFNNGGAIREDVDGNAYPLKDIFILNYKNDTIQRYEAYTSYFRSNVVNNACYLSAHRTELFSRLRLDSIANVTTPSLRQTTAFSYNDAISIPCAVSNAQDYWGFYNGANSNTSLIPYYHHPNGTFGEGADRWVNPAVSQWGLLEKITYPTGGTVNFEYESNIVFPRESSLVQPQQVANYIDNSNLDSTLITSYQIYKDTFCINNPPNIYLNNSNPMGGSRLSFVFDGLGYDWTNGMSDTALLYFNAIEPANSGYSTTISYYFNNYYVPNGCYEIKAQFLDDAPSDFFFMVYHNVLDTIIENQSPYVGGHRVAKITHHDGTDTVKKTIYDYNDPATGISSGDVFSTKYLPRARTFSCYETFNNSYAEVFGIRVFAEALTADANHTGSYVGYQIVSEINKDSAGTGKTVYKYSHIHDNVYVDEPVIPTKSYEELRGRLLEQTEHKFNNGNFLPVSRTVNTYLHDLLYQAEPSLYVSWQRTPLNNAGVEVAEKPIPFKATPYIHDVIKSVLTSSTQYLFKDGDSTKYSEITTIYYTNELNYLLDSTKTNGSNGEKLLTKYYRPYNVPTGIVSTTVNNHLLNSNNQSAVLAQVDYEDEQQTSRLEYVYDYQTSITPPVPVTVKKAVGSNVSEPRVHFDLYDQHGNLLQQRMDNNIYYSYIYGYNKRRLIAEAENALREQIAYTSFEDIDFGGWVISSPEQVILSSTAPTGHRVYSGSLSTTVPSGDYRLEFAAIGTVTVNSTNVTTNYVKELPNGYKWYSLLLDGISSISIAVDNIDEVRVYPQHATMKSYSWNDEGLLQSVVADNIQMQRYTYDGLLRLREVADADGNILNVFNYRLHNQPDVTDPNVVYYYNDYVSASFTRNNCIDGGIGNSITYTIPTGLFSSATSQADANLKAQQYLNNTGQQYANLYATCTWGNDLITQNFYRECSKGFVSLTPVPYSAVANTFTSNISKSHANALASNWLSVQGQINANENGVCVSACEVNCVGGPHKKCVQNVCETGIILMIDCEYDPIVGQYKAWYAYVFSDNSTSAPWYELTPYNCIEEEPEN